MKNKVKLRLIWIIPNLLMHLMFIICGIFVIIHADELAEINRLTIWVLALLALLFVNIFVSYRIWSWIKEGLL